jgi:hypothetical protein
MAVGPDNRVAQHAFAEEPEMVEPAVDREMPVRPPVPDALRIQILATEHWGMLAARSMTWNEMLARAGMFITVLSASIVSMALVAQATGFNDSFLVFAMLVLAIALLLGIGTMIRLADALEEDIWLVQGMNRIRNAYLDTAPELAPWISFGHHDDIAGILRSIGPERRVGGAGRILSAIVTTVAVINCLLVGVILTLGIGLVIDGFLLAIIAGLAGTIVSGTYALMLLPMRQVRRSMARLQPRFPTPIDSAENGEEAERVKFS